MAPFLSPEWLAELSAAAGGDEVGPDAVVVQQVVVGGPRGDVAFVVEVDGTALRARPGHDQRAVVTLVEAWETAVRIHQGELSLREALLRGRIRVRGDVRRLVEAASGLAALGDRLAPVRERTTVA